MALTSNEKRVVQEGLEALNSIISGPRLTLADLEVVNDYGDVRLKDEKRAEEIRKMLDRPIPSHERATMETVVEVLHLIAPTREEQERIDLERATADINRENVRRAHFGEPLLDLPRAKPVSKETKKATDEEMKRRATRAEIRRGPVTGPEQRTDVRLHEPEFREDVTPEVTKERHERGIYTPEEFPTDMILTPHKDDPAMVLTPRDEVTEDRAVDAARVVHEATGQLSAHDREMEVRKASTEAYEAEYGKAPDKKTLKAAEKDADEQRAETEKSAKEAVKHAKEVAKHNDELRPQIKTMKSTPVDDPRAPGEQPTLREELEVGTPEGDAKEGKKNAPKKRKTAKAIAEKKTKAKKAKATKTTKARQPTTNEPEV